MVFVLPSFLVVIHYIIINTIKSSNYRLLLGCILSTGNRRIKPPYDLKAITLVILNSSSRGLIIIDVKNLLKITGSPTRTPITYYPKHNGVGVVLHLNILVHPDLPDEIQRLNAETFTYSMGQPNSPRNIGQAYHLTHVTNVVLSIERLDLTRALTALRDIRAPVHSVDPGLPVHGPVGPCLCFGDADNGGNSTAHRWGVEVETPAYLRSGRGNDDLCWTLRHNF
uniref:AC5 n=1 Tax=Tomato leaf curl Gujarat virus TaxID=219299 RepID=A0A2S1ZWF2_9GEMI|nr:AC5 [Tomato leaf curl Gujarat virus]